MIADNKSYLLKYTWIIFLYLKLIILKYYIKNKKWYIFKSIKIEFSHTQCELLLKIVLKTAIKIYFLIKAIKIPQNENILIS